MVQRKTLQAKSENGIYFPQDHDKVQFISTGCALLDQVLGGGYVLGRIANIVGDKSVGKTLLAIEAAANFARTYPEGRIYYAEVESAFDIPYAAQVGLPTERVRFPANIETVEDWYEHLEGRIDKLNGRPALYILDSLDALSDRSEMKRKFDDSTYGTGKAKQMSQLFRRLVRRIAVARVAILVISQVRDKIDAMAFGRKYTRTGGKALDFYATHVLYLAHIHKEKRTIDGVTRPTGVLIKAMCDKNKISWPYRECQFQITFGYGIDDVGANVDFLVSVGQHKSIGLETKDPKTVKKFIRSVYSQDDAAFRKQRNAIAKAVGPAWKAVEREFAPKRSKYG